MNRALIVSPPILRVLFAENVAVAVQPQLLSPKLPLSEPANRYVS
jgi:hypothetical protein